MIKNKYFIGQTVRTKKEGCEFRIDEMKENILEGEIVYSNKLALKFFMESELEPLPEKKKIVLWQWMLKDSDGYVEAWASENYYKNSLWFKTGATKEVEIL